MALLKPAETMVRSSATGAVLAWRCHEQPCMKRSAYIWMEVEVQRVRDQQDETADG